MLSQGKSPSKAAAQHARCAPPRSAVWRHTCESSGLGRDSGHDRRGERSSQLQNTEAENQKSSVQNPSAKTNWHRFLFCCARRAGRNPASQCLYPGMCKNCAECKPMRSRGCKGCGTVRALVIIANRASTPRQREPLCLFCVIFGRATESLCARVGLTWPAHPTAPAESTSSMRVLGESQATWAPAHSCTCHAHAPLGSSALGHSSEKAGTSAGIITHCELHTEQKLLCCMLCRLH